MLVSCWKKKQRRSLLNDIALEQVVKTSLSSKLDGQKLSSLVISALRSVGKNALYNGSMTLISR